MKKAQEYANKYLEIMKEIEMIIDTSDDYDSDLIDHMENYAINLEDDLNKSEKEIYYQLINEMEA